jgi:hypothetical protein
MSLKFKTGLKRLLVALHRVQKDLQGNIKQPSVSYPPVLHSMVNTATFCDFLQHMWITGYSLLYRLVVKCLLRVKLVGLQGKPRARLLKVVLNKDYMQTVTLIWKEITVINNDSSVYY